MALRSKKCVVVNRMLLGRASVSILLLIVVWKFSLLSSSH